MAPNALLLVAASLAIASASVAEPVLLFPYFDSNGENGVYLAYSEDGREFHALNDGRPIFVPPRWSDGQRLTRDPSIVWHDGLFHMVWTSNWSGRWFGYASSPDLRVWSEPKRVQAFPDGGEQPNNVWAPEVFRDHVAGNFKIVWSSTFASEYADGDGSEDTHKGDHRMYYTETTDFESFSQPELIYPDQGWSVIDAQVAWDAEGDRWVMPLKKEVPPERGGKNIRLAFSPPEVRPGGFGGTTEPLVGPGTDISGRDLAEGPSLVRWKDRWLLYWDSYTAKHYSLAISDDLQTWTDETARLSFPVSHPRHGSVFVADKHDVAWFAAPLPADGDPALGAVADKPLYVDAVYDGAADPVVIWNPARERWWMFFTNRRANAPGLKGVAWVHGTPIGIAESNDGGATWRRVGDIEASGPGVDGQPTFWAPEVIAGPDTFHMFLTVVPGVFSDWRHPRSIVHLTSEDLRQWRSEGALSLASDRVIDACVLPLPSGGYRMWYNNERDKKSIYYADSDDLYDWTDRGKAVGDQGGEGPKVFRWGGAYWMITDVWDGLAVYRSEDLVDWSRQADNLLREPGDGPDDQVKGSHPDVVVSDGRAFLFYFTHPGRKGPDAGADGPEQRRSVIQVVELHRSGDQLVCDRDAPTRIRLVPPESNP